MGIFGLLLKIVDRIPESRHLAALGQRYAERCRGDNDADPESNGEYRLLRAVLPRAQIVLDCGANVGNWTRTALAFNPGLQIHCFEPSPTNFAKLKLLAVPGKVVCNNVGVGAAEEERMLNVYEESGQLNSLFRRTSAESSDATPQRTETIKLTTIDGYLRSNNIAHVDFAKIDVEGNELAAFNGMADTLKSGAVDLVQFEYGGTFLDAGILLRDIFAFMQPYPYDFFKILPKRLRAATEYSQGYETYAYQNWLLARRGWDGLDRAGVVRV
jgi:FkbM family methyltransferase